MKPSATRDRHEAASWAVRRPWATIVAAVVLACIGAALVSRLRPSNSLEDLLNQHDPATVALAHVLRDFATTEDLLLLVGVPEASAADEAQRIGSLIGFAERLERAITQQPARAALVRSISYRAGDEAQRFMRQTLVPGGVYYLDDARYAELLERLSGEGMRRQLRLTEAVLSSPTPAMKPLARLAAQDPLRLHELVMASVRNLRPRLETHGGTDAFIDATGRWLLMRVSGREPSTKLEFTDALMSMAREAVAEAGPGELSVRYGGGYAIAEHAHHEIRGDMIASVVGSVVMLQALFLVVYRRWYSFGLIFGPVALGILWGFGMYAVTGLGLTPVTATAGAILAGLGIDYCVHVHAHYTARRRGGATAAEAAELRGGMRVKLAAAAATSVLGFGVMQVSDVPALRQFSLLGSLGLLGCVGAAMVVMPAMLVIADRRGGAVRGGEYRVSVSPLVRWVMRRRVWSVSVAVAAAVAAAAAIGVGVWRGAVFDPDLAAVHPQPNPPLATHAEIGRRFSGALDAMVIHLQAENPRALLRLAHRVSAKLEAIAGDGGVIRRPMGIDAFLPDPELAARRAEQVRSIDVGRVLRDFDAAMEDSALSAAAFGGYRQMLGRLLRPDAPPGVEALGRYPGLSGTLLPKAALESAGGRVSQALTLAVVPRPFADRHERGRAVAAVRGALGEMPGATLTGMSVIGDDMIAAVRADLPVLLGLSTALVLAYLAAALRGIRAALWALLPCGLGLMMATAALLIAGRGFNMMNLMAMPMLVGFGVDYGVFIVAGRQGGGRGEADVQAVTICCLTTLLGFGTLVFSSTPAIGSLGLLLGAGIIGCWIGAVMVLAPVLRHSSEQHA